MSSDKFEGYGSQVHRRSLGIMASRPGQSQPVGDLRAGFWNGAVWVLVRDCPSNVTSRSRGGTVCRVTRWVTPVKGGGETEGDGEWI